MNIIEKLFSKMFFRNVLTDLGYRRAYSRISGDFTPYFAYKIGDYENGYHLNFPKEPIPVRYKNEIFNKLHRLDNVEIGKYLDFHFDLYLQTPVKLTTPGRFKLTISRRSKLTMLRRSKMTT